jgi:23S rRNA (cytidine1920-2'-O)/16S rRNA (cytidine1409-2'-O)-methyltransferase
MAGRVYVDGERAEKAGVGYPRDACIEVRGLEERFASRGGEKLAGALVDLTADPKGMVVLDAGASAGGFTDCLLQHGAIRVYAVDVGYGQLAGRLRVDPRVVCLERTNISDVMLSALVPRPQLATLDLSYLSLRKAVPIVAPLLSDPARILCLVKPLFETEDTEARRSGVIHEEGEYRRILEGLAEEFTDQGHGIGGVCRSRITGSGGTVEFFMDLQIRSGGKSSAETARAISLACED